MNTIDISIIIVTYNSENDVEGCLKSISETKGSLAVEVIVVDNCSVDRTAELVRSSSPDAKLILNETNAGFPAANNQVFPLATGRKILLLNPDTILQPGGLRALSLFMDANPTCGLCGPRLLGIEGQEAPELHQPTVLLMVARLLRWKWAQRRIWKDSTLIICGACLMFRRELLDRVGVLDSSLFWTEDVDFSIRVRAAGYGIRLVREASVIHKEGQSIKRNIGQTLYVQNASVFRLVNKHYRWPHRPLILCLRLIEIGLRIVKSAFLAAFWRFEYRNRRDGLLRVCRDLPSLLRAGKPDSSRGTPSPGGAL